MRPSPNLRKSERLGLANNRSYQWFPGPSKNLAVRTRLSDPARILECRSAPSDAKTPDAAWYADGPLPVRETVR